MGGALNKNIVLFKASTPIPDGELVMGEGQSIKHKSHPVRVSCPSSYIYFFIFFLLVIALLFIFGCVEGTTVPPFTTSQFVNKITDLNYTLFQQGYYDGNLVMFDGNKFSVFALDINSYDINWSQLINFPSGCGANQAVNSDGNIFVNRIYGGIYFHSEAGGTIEFAVQDTYYDFNYGTCGALNGFVCDGNAGTLTATYGGEYTVNYLASGTGSNNHVYHTMVFVNDANNINTIAHATVASGTVTDMAGLGHIRVNAGQVVKLKIADSSGTSTGTVYNWNMILDRVGN